MRTLIDFSIMQEYDENVLTRGDRLSAISKLVNWNAFLPIGDRLYKNNIQVADRISFRVFLGTTEVIPDYTTVWLFRKRLEESSKYEAIC
jgi:IS5 family transposase